MTRRLRQLLALTALVAGAAGSTSVPADPVFAQGQQGADVILTNGKIITVDETLHDRAGHRHQGRARFIAVGTNQDIASARRHRRRAESTCAAARWFPG